MLWTMRPVVRHIERVMDEHARQIEEAIARWPLK